MFDKATIDHIVINSKSRIKMADFYCNVLGFRVERNIPAMTQLKLGSILIDLLDLGTADSKDKARKNIDHLYKFIKRNSKNALKMNGLKLFVFKINIIIK